MLSSVKYMLLTVMTFSKLTISFLIIILTTNVSLAAAKPNIIFIFTDDIGFNEIQWYPEHADISSYQPSGDEPFFTPNIYQIAQEGVRFTNYHSPAPLCSPARAGVLTGRYPSEFAIRDFLNLGTLRGLPANTPTVASVLRDEAGYATGHFGKWNLGQANKNYFPVHYGFDESMVRLAVKPFDGYQGSVFVEGDDLAGRKAIAPDEHSTTTITNRAVEFMRASAEEDKPYFVNLWYRAPHVPIDPPATFPDPLKDTRRMGVDIDLGNWQRSWGEFVAANPALLESAYLENHSPTSDAWMRAQYIALIAWLDHEVGRLVAAADEIDPSGNTIIIFTSDNGGHGSYATGSGDVPGTWSPNGELRDGKRSPYEGGIRVPFIVRWPAAHLAAGKTNDSLLTGLDLFPTFAAAAGAGVGDLDLPGYSALDTFVGDGRSIDRSEPVFWETSAIGTLFGRPDKFTTLDDEQNRYAVWDESLHRKLVIQRDRKGQLNTSLFDTNNVNKSGVNEDDIEIPGLNLAKREPENVARLEKAYRGWRQSIGQIKYQYDLAGSTAQVSEESVIFSQPGDVAKILANERFVFRESNFSFQSLVALESLPGSAGSMIAEHPGSWSVWLSPGANQDAVQVHAAFTARDSVKNTRASSEGDSYLPGDTVELSSKVSCRLPCNLDIAFTVLGITSEESSFRLYINGEPMDEFRANPKDDVNMYEIYADNAGPIYLGNNLSGEKPLQGKIFSPGIFSLYLRPAEVIANMKNPTDNM
jgi:arylsulfatase A-like enzyme